MTHHYRTRGTCSREIRFDIDNGVVHNVHFEGGCNGNTQGVSLLVEGMPAAEVVKRLSGVNCNGRGTSCPDQLAKAVAAALEEEH